MKVDVSEIKTFRNCKRQWQLSSRNKFHLQPVAPQPQLAFGTIFHEALAELYLGVDYEKVMAMVRKEMFSDTDMALIAMLKGYYENVLPGDLDRFKVLDVEHHFEFAPTTSDGEYLFPQVEKRDAQGNIVYDANGDPIWECSLMICGSIDMIVLDTNQSKIYGFEHKTCKSFRDPTYVWMDEQPRVYTWALQKYVDQYNETLRERWIEEGGKEPEYATLGGVYLNEVKKLLRQFQYNRTLCQYSQEDLDNFMQAFYISCTQCKHMVDNNDFAVPQPSYFSCSMCAFNTICTTYMYSNLDKEELLKEFSEEFKERSEDHLDEKQERSTSE